MEQQQNHQRRDNMVPFRQTIMLLLGVTCFATVSTCLHASFSLHRALSTPSATEASTSMQVSAVGKSIVEHGPRAFRSTTESNAGKSLLREKQATKTVQSKNKLDFIIAGFPKTGTTSLLYAFGDHPETSIASKERCAVTNPTTSDEVAFGKLQESLSELSTSPNVKHAIKCPNTVYHAYSAIVRFEEHAPDAKFVIGLRHPVDMMQSYYNYRVTELYDTGRQKQAGTKKKKTEKIPPLDSLLGVEREWKGVSTDSTRFENYLMQFGKARVDAKDMQEMLSKSDNPVERKSHHWAVKPNKFSIFLYTVDQLEDADAQRSQSFRQGLQRFLELKKPLKPVGRENLNHFVGKKAHPETVDICLPKYSSLRRMLLKQGAHSAEWIEHEFLQSADVAVGNKEHFLDSIRSWSVDPCKETKASRGSSSILPIVESKRRIHKTAIKAVGDSTKPPVVQKQRLFVGRGRNIEIVPVKV